MYHNGQKVTIEPAEEPTDIIWENMHYSDFYKMIGRLKGTIITFLFIALILYLLMRINI